jgi:hypothetical protein
LINEVEDGGLARAVGANESKDLTPLYLEAHPAHCHETTEVLADLFHFKETHRQYPSLSVATL